MRQEQVNQIYSRNARFYNWMDEPMERRYGAKIRPLMFEGLEGSKMIEVGAGTGKSFPFYPRNAVVTAIEPSRGMRELAAQNAAKLGVAERVTLVDADVQNLPYPDSSFDAALASFVFCSVADPVKGLQELHRVLRPGGVLRLLEHQRPPNRFLAALFDLFNPLVSRMVGANINRDTTNNVKLAGFTGVNARPLDKMAIVRYIEATRVASATTYA